MVVARRLGWGELDADGLAVLDRVETVHVGLLDVLVHSVVGVAWGSSEEFWRDV